MKRWSQRRENAVSLLITSLMSEILSLQLTRWQRMRDISSREISYWSVCQSISISQISISRIIADFDFKDNCWSHWVSLWVRVYESDIEFDCESSVKLPQSFWLCALKWNSFHRVWVEKWVSGRNALLFDFNWFRGLILMVSENYNCISIVGFNVLVRL